MKKMRQQKFNDFPRSEPLTDGSISQTWGLESYLHVSSPTRKGCLVPDSFMTKTVWLHSTCLSLLSVSLFIQGLSSLFSFSPFPSLPCSAFSFLSPPTAGFLSLSLSLCMHPTLDLSSYQSNMCRKAPLQGGLTYNVILWQRPQEGHWNETLVNYSGALSWLHALAPHHRWNSH